MGRLGPSEISARAEELARAFDRHRRRVSVAAGMLAAALPIAVLWGFTVDDALIPARVAAHLARGMGYRFNASGPPVDASTPLGWPYVLMPFARAGVLSAHRAAKLIGAIAWILAAGGLAAMVDASARGRLRYAPLGVLALSLPMGAWAASGMETGIVMALGTAALVPHPLGALAAGLAAAFRPELIGWAVVLSGGLSLTSDGDASPRKRGARWASFVRALAFAAVPAVVVAGIRQWAFGSAAPLAVYAKPSDTAHGAYYAAAGLIWLGAPLLVLAPFAVRALGGRYRSVLVAAGVHTLSLIAAGGDWMPYFRLWTPIVPGLLLVAAVLVDHSRRWASAIRLALALGVCALLDVRHVAAARRIEDQRSALIEGARALLGGVRFPATVDVGWLGAAGDYEVRDLAGATDWDVALLPGGHTSKKVPFDWLDRRRVDALVLLLAEGESPTNDYRQNRFARVVENRMAGFARDLSFEPAGTLPLLGTTQRYLLLRRSAAP